MLHVEIKYIIQGSEPTGKLLPGSDHKIQSMLCKLKTPVIRTCEEPESVSAATLISFHNLESLVLGKRYIAPTN